MSAAGVTNYFTAFLWRTVNKKGCLLLLKLLLRIPEPFFRKLLKVFR
jgi:hypothetical protein